MDARQRTSRQIHLHDTGIMIHRLAPGHWAARLQKSLSLCLLVASLSACALKGVEYEEEPVPRAPAEVARLEETVGRQKTRIMELELRLLAKQSEIQRMSLVQEQAIQEVVRVKAKLRSRNSKAETVANLAEVKLALQGLQTQDAQYSDVEGLERARQYVAMSEAALDEQNYDGAFYLIGQAKALFTSMALPEERPEANSNSQIFSIPVRMTVTQRCNVRTGPGTDKRVLTQLDAGTTVLAVGYRQLWVRIQQQDDTTGWIHYSLLDADL